MKKVEKNKTILVVAIIFTVALIIGGTYAYYTWYSNVNKLVTLNTSKELSEYIIYNGNKSVFVGDLNQVSSYTGGMSSTFSIAKTEAADVINLEATVHMTVNAIDTEIKNSNAVKWAVTSGNASSNGTLLASGTFNGATAGTTKVLLTSQTLTTTLQEYTVWIWIDSSASPSADLVGKTLDVGISVQVDQVM